jgi:hypothetical protein
VTTPMADQDAASHLRDFAAWYRRRTAAEALADLEPVGEWPEGAEAPFRTAAG